MDPPSIPLVGERAHKGKVDFELIIEQTAEPRSSGTLSVYFDVPNGELTRVSRYPQRDGDRPVSSPLESGVGRGSLGCFRRGVC